jgi:hypothetical protein
MYSCTCRMYCIVQHQSFAQLHRLFLRQGFRNIVSGLMSSLMSTWAYRLQLLDTEGTLTRKRPFSCISFCLIIVISSSGISFVESRHHFRTIFDSQWNRNERAWYLWPDALLLYFYYEEFVLFFATISIFYSSKI